MDKKNLLEALEKEVKVCERCRLYKTATNGVPGEGNPDSQIFFIGEAPGYHEDMQGRPFVGRAGKLLEKLLSEIGLARLDVYITNVLKHRPPDNRDPHPDEIKECKRYLDRQLEIIDPKMIVALGRFGLCYFFPDGKISKDHGVPRMAHGRMIYPVYHPAAALRNPAVAAALREDFLKIPRVLEEKDQLLYQGAQITDNEDQMRLFK